MAEKFDHFSTEDIMALAASPAGQQLLTLLQKSGGKELQQAMALAAAGNMAGAKAHLAPFLADPQVQALLGRLGGK